MSLEDKLKNSFARKVESEKHSEPEPKVMNGLRTFEDDTVVQNLPYTPPTRVRESALDPIVAIIGEDVELRPLQRHSYEFFQNQVAKLKEMNLRSKGKFNMSEYVRKALDSQMRKDGLIK